MAEVSTGNFTLAAGTALSPKLCCRHLRHFGAPCCGRRHGFTTAVGTSGSVTSGRMSFSGQASATVATAASYADIITRNEPGNPTGPTAGKSIVFTVGTDDYVFIQGGAAGTADDYVMAINGVSGNISLTGQTVLFNGD